MYDDDAKGHCAKPGRSHLYIYPTGLPSVHQQIRFSQAVRNCRDAKKNVIVSDDVYDSVLTDPVAAIPHPGPSKQAGISSTGTSLRSSSGFGITSKSMDAYLKCCQPIRDLGLCLPPARLAQPSELSRREQEIYRMPDSDDEVIESFKLDSTFSSGIMPCIVVFQW